VKRPLSTARSIRRVDPLPAAALRALKAARASAFVYSSFGFYARRRGMELTGTWLVAALADVGVPPATSRKTLWRMEREGELVSRRAGRSKLYRATPLAWAEIESGADKILRSPAQTWNGRWTLVTYAFEAEERVERERIKAVLDAEGFGVVGPGAYIHPRDRGGRVLAAAEEQGMGARLRVFRGARLVRTSDAELARSLWDLRESALRYRRFLQGFDPLAGRARSLAPPVAFAARFAVVLAYLEAAWPDPELPPSLLPPNWPGPVARALAAKLYRALLPAALAHGDAIRDRTGMTSRPGHPDGESR
jgi:phenylacetic acid degradation operon negative regulatory protein